MRRRADRVTLPASVAGRLGQIVRGELDDEIVQAAVAAGLVPGEAVTAAQAACDRDPTGPSLCDRLVQEGRLRREDLAALEKRRARQTFVRPAVVRPTPAPPEVAAAAADPQRWLGGFVLVERRGRGGAAEVWKAWDSALGRWVAVKISTASFDSPTARERFEREVAAVARLRHPSLVPAYQSGIEDERAYIVMPYIDGQTLAEAQLPVRRAVEVARAVALALEHAHAAGVFHRDLKPGNIMLDREDGVFVLDFGLAFLRDDTSHPTRPGDLLGTAAYMAPEQARADASVPSPATDVYALGATLYHLIAGRPPFEGASFAETVARVLAVEPPPLRRFVLRLDGRLEAVVAKAMEKDPRRRYATVAALAEDLRRVLDHEEVSARPAGPLRRLARLARRRPGWAAAAVLVVVAVAALGVRLRVRAQQAAALATMRQLTQVSVDLALRLRRAGDPAGMREALPPLVAAYRRAQESGSGSADLDHLMGQVYRALQDDERALWHQERALAADPEHAAALYDRALLLSQQYGVALARAQVSTIGADPNFLAKETRLVAENPRLAELRARVLADYQRLQRAPLAETKALAARGILAFHERRFAEALEILRDVEKRLNMSAPGSVYHQDVAFALARTLAAIGRGAEARGVYDSILARDRGYLPALVDRCHLWARDGRRNEAIQDATAALAMHPGLIDAIVCRGTARSLLGHDSMMKGAGAAAAQALDLAERDFGEALSREPRLVPALWGRGSARRYRAMLAQRRCEPELPWLRQSEADLAAAVTIEPRASDCWSGLGRTRTLLAEALWTAGEDGTAAATDAEQALDRAALLEPERADTREWLGDLSLLRARMAWARGQDAAVEAARAADGLTSLIVGGWDNPWARLRRAALRIEEAEAAIRAERDPEPAWQQAERDLAAAAKALRGRIDVPRAEARLATARAAAARDARSRARHLAKAEERLRAAVDLDGEDVRVLRELARVAGMRGAAPEAAALTARADALCAEAVANR
jgi:hypothetical protein